MYTGEEAERQVRTTDGKQAGKAACRQVRRQIDKQIHRKKSR